MPNNNFDPVKNFTPRARQALLLAQREAERLNHDSLGTEHLLLGILALNDGVAVNVLQKNGINLEQLRYEVEKVCFGEQEMTQNKTNCNNFVNKKAPSEDGAFN